MKSVFTPVVKKGIKNSPAASYSQVVEFLAGHYKINDEIAVGSYANVITGSEAIIERTDEAKNIFNFPNVWKSWTVGTIWNNWSLESVPKILFYSMMSRLFIFSVDRT
jgi:hypothetical protein